MFLCCGWRTANCGGSQCAQLAAVPRWFCGVRCRARAIRCSSRTKLTIRTGQLYRVSSLRAGRPRRRSTIREVFRATVFTGSCWCPEDGQGGVSYAVRRVGSERGRDTGDFDGDGVTDLQEFLAGTDPTNRGSVLRVMTLTCVYGGSAAILWSATVCP